MPDRIARRSTAIPEKFPFHVPVFVGQSAISGEFYQKLLGKKPEFSWLLLPKDYIENGFQVLYTHDTQRQKKRQCSTHEALWLPSIWRSTQWVTLRGF